jgi:hypothetical protein
MSREKSATHFNRHRGDARRLHRQPDKFAKSAAVVIVYCPARNQKNCVVGLAVAKIWQKKSKRKRKQIKFLKLQVADIPCVAKCLQNCVACADKHLGIAV